MVGLEGTSRIMKLQPPPNRQGHQPPHFIAAQAAQGPIQPGLEHLQGWGILCSAKLLLVQSTGCYLGVHFRDAVTVLTALADV